MNTDPEPEDPYGESLFEGLDVGGEPQPAHNPEPEDVPEGTMDVHWGRLIEKARGHDAGLAAILETFQGLGRRLERQDGTFTIRPADESDAEDYARDREYLLPHASWLKVALKDLVQEVGDAA